MPELPEVETVRRAADRRLSGHMITSLRVRNPRLRRLVAPAALKRACLQQTIRRIDRRGKFLLVRLDGPTDLLLHLGMSGAFRVLPSEVPADNHEHVIWTLDDGWDWRFHDPRRFGSVELLSSADDTPSHPSLVTMGPEPLDPAWNGNELHTSLRATRRAIKLALLDQHVLAGLGNIYVCEALFAAGISPFRRADRVSRSRCGRLAACIREVLHDAIEHGGTSLRDYTRLDGSEGHFALRLRVYGREEQPCPRCGPSRRIRRRVQQNRSSFYCPACQR